MNSEKSQKNPSVDDLNLEINNDLLCSDNCQNAKRVDFIEMFDTKEKSSQIMSLDFKISIVLNQNAFRSIVLVKDKKTGRKYVAKVFKKKKIVKNDLVSLI